MRIDDNIGTHLSKQQFGFRKNTRILDAIFIVEKAKEHQVPLRLNCVEFNAAFDAIWKGALWKMLRSIGEDPNITSLIEAMCDTIECVILLNV